MLDSRGRKEQKDEGTSVKVEQSHLTQPRGGRILHEKEYNTGHGIPAILNEVRGEIRRQPGQPEVQQEPVVYLLLACPLGWECGISGLSVPASSQPPKPAHRSGTEVKDMRRRITDPELRLFQYTAIDEFSRLRFLAAYPEQSTYSSADFLKRLAKWYARRGIRVDCVQTDIGFEFTNRFSNSKRDIQTLFEKTAAVLGIQHKLIRP